MSKTCSTRDQMPLKIDYCDQCNDAFCYSKFAACPISNTRGSIFHRCSAASSLNIAGSAVIILISLASILMAL